jgi:uncharacterized protein YkwD
LTLLSRGFSHWGAPTILAVMILACTESSAMATSVAGRTSALAPTTGPVDPEVRSFVKLMNAHRVSLGLSALVWDRRAAAVAQAHCRDMFRRHYFSHTSPDGRSTWDRLAASGITYSEAGENIAWGQSTGRAVLTAWLRSPGHRANIERGSYTHHGVGKVGAYWTQVFIRPTEPPIRSRRGDPRKHRHPQDRSAQDSDPAYSRRSNRLSAK